MPYKWDRETITVAEISEILFEQYNRNPMISVTIPDGSKVINYKKELIPVQCNRCGNTYQIPPSLLLSMKEDRGYACGQCGSLSDSELQDKLRLDRLKIGRETLLAMGENPDEEDEEEKEKADEERAEEAMANAMLEGSNDFIDEKAIIEEESKIQQQVQPPPPPPPQQIPPPKVKEVAPPPKQAATESAAPIEKQEEKDLKDAFDDFVGLEDGEEQFEDYFDEDNDVINNDEINLSDIISDENEEDEEDEDDIDEAEVASNESEDDIEDEEEPEEVPDEVPDEAPAEEEEYVYLNNKRFTFEGLSNRYNVIQKSLQEKLGLIPYDGIKYNNGILEVTCKLCDKTFEVNDLESLIDDVVTFDKENCFKYGLKFKGPLTISSCPHCRHSILMNGFNEFYRKKVEHVIAKSKLNIVKPEMYWYASPLASYVLEANGVTQNINYIDLCNKYVGLDMSKHELFTPRGDDTKSEATPVDNTEEVIRGGHFSLPKHDPKHQFFFDATETSQEPVYERQQEQAKSQMVFHPSDKYKNINESIAVLNGLENPFEREEKLDAAFKKSAFYEFTKELAEECHVRFRYQINQKTFEIPIIDFEPYEEEWPGFRLICADYNRNSMFNVPFHKVADALPFQFQVKKSKFIYSVLYSDSLTFRTEATFNALIKYINPTILAYGGKRIQLEGNLTIQYTDYSDYLNEFYEKYSPFPDGKPKTPSGELGILASWSSSKTFDAKDILETLASLENNRGPKANLDKLENDFGQYMVASIRYIERLNKDTGRVLYTITEYVEIGGALIADGLYQCIKALLKEYYLKYPEMRDRSPHIVLELDPNNFTSPSLRPYIKKNSLVPMNKIFRSQLLTNKERERMSNYNHVEQYFRYVYVQKKEYRPKGVECIRKDIRKFSAKTLIKTMPEEIRAAGLQTEIYFDTPRLLFIQNMGYVYATQLEIKEYFVNQGIVQQILLDGNTILMSKAINPDSMFSNGGIVDSSGNSVATINNIMYNPLFRAKMDKLQYNNMTPEAVEFYNSYVAQKQQEMQNDAMFRQQQNPFGVWQNPQQPQNPTMTFGAYAMPNMPGMNYKT